MTVKELLQRMDAREFAEWFCFYNLEPFGDDHRQSSMIAAAVYNNNPHRKGKALQPEDFMCIKKQKKVLSSDQLEQALKNTFAVMFGSK
jgi:hypothetical protein